MTLLLLAGTGDARALARGLAQAGIATVATLAGATRAPAALAVPVRMGGFGGRAGFEAFLQAEGISAVLDATHPFASRITERTAAVCAARGLPYLRYERPPWVPQAGDRWTMIDDERDVAHHVAPGSVVFLATGGQSLGRFADLRGCRVICRRIDPAAAPFPFAGGEFVIGRPPFHVADEVALFRALGVDVLVVRNAGGTASRAKLDAARMLDLPVLMIRRPAPVDAPCVATRETALEWALQQMEAT